MKSIFNLPRLAVISIVAALTTMVTACGQPGPLYLPTKPAPISKPADVTKPSPTLPIAETPIPASK